MYLVLRIPLIYSIIFRLNNKTNGCHVRDDGKSGWDPVGVFAFSYPFNRLSALQILN